LEVGDLVQNNVYTQDYGVGIVTDTFEHDGDVHVCVRWSNDTPHTSENDWWHTLQVKLISEV